MFKNLFEKGKCLVGLHQGEWEYEQPGECTQLRVCQRCAAQSRKTEHVWQEWAFATEGNCAQNRLCARCGEREQRVQHEWGAPRYQADDSCEEVRDCVRCHEEAPIGARHEWNTWEYASTDACLQRQICARCGSASAESRLVHRWGPAENSAHYGGAVRVCRQCGEIEMPVRMTAPVDAARPTEFSGGISDSDVAGLLRRAGVAEATQAAAPATPKANADERLVGHWRHTSSMSSGGFSMVTDTHWILEGNGRFTRYSETVSGMGSNRSDSTGGSWEAARGGLRFNFDDGDVAEHAYELSGETLFLPQEGHFRIWERV